MLGKLFIIDANFLIDLLKIDSRLLQIICKFIQVIIPNVILDEVASLSEDLAKQLGIEIFEVELETLILAQSITNNSGLSVQDAVCLLMAKAHNLGCVTNDKLLYNRAKTENIDILWGLELILCLCSHKEIDKNYSTEIAEKLNQINIKITPKIMEEFYKQLKIIN